VPFPPSQLRGVELQKLSKCTCLTVSERAKDEERAEHCLLSTRRRDRQTHLVHADEERPPLQHTLACAFREILFHEQLLRLPAGRLAERTVAWGDLLWLREKWVLVPELASRSLATLRPTSTTIQLSQDNRRRSFLRRCQGGGSWAHRFSL